MSNACTYRLLSRHPPVATRLAQLAPQTIFRPGHRRLWYYARRRAVPETEVVRAGRLVRDANAPRGYDCSSAGLRSTSFLLFIYTALAAPPPVAQSAAISATDRRIASRQYGLPHPCTQTVSLDTINTARKI